MAHDAGMLCLADEAHGTHFYFGGGLPVSAMEMCIRDRYNRIAEAIQSLNILPERCALVESEPERTQGLRQMLVDNYSVFYIVGEDRCV